MADTAFQKLMTEYSALFRDFDDQTLARWLSQTLSQFEGKVLRLSHPLVGAYRIASQVAADRQIGLNRLAAFPPAFPEAPCCRTPALHLFTREVLETGLVCQHCGETLVPFEDLPATVKPLIKTWAEEYGPIHQQAHAEETRWRTEDPEEALENAARHSEKLLAFAGKSLMPHLIEFYPAILWEDQDECLEVLPEDIV